jgi:hypothetical protein
VTGSISSALSPGDNRPYTLTPSHQTVTLNDPAKVDRRRRNADSDGDSSNSDHPQAEATGDSVGRSDLAVADAVVPADPVEQHLGRARLAEPVGELLAVEFLSGVKWFGWSS